MTLKNIGRYHEETNATAIIYKKYGHTVDDIYPTFSVCIKGDGLYRFNETAIFAAYGIHLSDYEAMMDGRLGFQYKYDISSRRYTKHPLLPKFEPIIDFEEQDLFQSPDIVKSASFVAENQSQNIVFGNNDGISAGHSEKEPLLYISYQSLKLFCLTRKQDYTPDLIRDYDSLMLDLSSLDSNSRIKIFVHYPGQVIRSFDTRTFPVSTFPDTGVTFRVPQITILKKTIRSRGDLR